MTTSRRGFLKVVSTALGALLPLYLLPKIEPIVYPLVIGVGRGSYWLVDNIGMTINIPEAKQAYMDEVLNREDGEG